MPANCPVPVKLVREHKGGIHQAKPFATQLTPKVNDTVIYPSIIGNPSLHPYLKCIFSLRRLSGKQYNITIKRDAQTKESFYAKEIDKYDAAKVKIKARKGLAGISREGLPFRETLGVIYMCL